MNDKDAALYDQLVELDRILNGFLGLGFTYLVTRDIYRRKSFVHVVTPEWLSECTMMPFHRDHTLCTTPISKTTEHGYVDVNERQLYTEVPPSEVDNYKGHDVKLHVCQICVDHLRNTVWPVFYDDEDLEGVEHTITIDDPPEVTIRTVWRGL